MAKKTKSVPDGYHTATPYLNIKNAAAAIVFYKQAFGAVELVEPFTGPGGVILHAEIRIGDSPIMIAEEMPASGNASPTTLGGSPVTIALYFDDVDAVVARAVAAGAKLLRPVADQFYGDRNGRLEDPFGHLWIVGTHKEDVPLEEMKQRAAALFGAA